MTKLSLPYRSQRRDAPRIITPLGGARKARSEVGEFLYSHNAPSFSEALEQAKAHNRRLLSGKFRDESGSIIESIDDLHTIASRYMWAIWNWGDAEPSPVQDVLFPCFHKTLFSIYISHDLTLSGLYGPARPHLRHAFESLMIGKYCSTNPSSDVFDRWVDGVDLYFANSVLKKITHPDTSEFREAWKLLCDWTHATVFAGQPSLSLQDTEDATLLNFGFTEILLQWTYHLLSRHMLTPSVRYYGNRYAKSDKGKVAQKRIRERFKWQGKFLGHDAQRLIRDYKAVWKVI